MDGVRFSQAQVREMLGLEPETMRHWRKALPALAGRPRKAPYEHADLLAIAVVKRLVRDLGLPVSELAGVDEELFSLCRGTRWPQLSRCRLRLEGGEGIKLEPLGAPPNLGTGAVVLLPLGPIIAELSRPLLGPARPQGELRFPLTAQSRRRS
jgi:hypothetical protein